MLYQSVYYTEIMYIIPNGILYGLETLVYYTERILYGGLLYKNIRARNGGILYKNGHGGKKLKKFQKTT